MGDLATSWGKTWRARNAGVHGRSMPTARQTLAFLTCQPSPLEAAVRYLSICEQLLIDRMMKNDGRPVVAAVIRKTSKDPILLDNLSRVLRCTQRVAEKWIAETCDQIGGFSDSELAGRIDTLLWAWDPAPLLSRDGDLQAAAVDGLLLAA